MCIEITVNVKALSFGICNICIKFKLITNFNIYNYTAWFAHSCRFICMYKNSYSYKINMYIEVLDK